VRVAEVVFSGFGLLPLDRVNTIRATTALQPGKPIAKADVQETARLAATALWNAGYAKARVEALEAAIAPDRVGQQLLRSCSKVIAHLHYRNSSCRTLPLQPRHLRISAGAVGCKRWLCRRYIMQAVIGGSAHCARGKSCPLGKTATIQNRPRSSCTQASDRRPEVA
jgi:hypothetical protein